MPSPEHPEVWSEKDVLAADGAKVGSVDGIYLDDRTGEPAFMLVKGGLLGLRQHFVPLAGAEADDQSIRVPYDAETIKRAPNVAADDHLSPEEEQELFTHYDLHYGEPSGVVEVRLRRWVVAVDE